MTETTERAPRRRAPGRDAPVAYADIRPRLQRARVAMGVALTVAAAASWVFGSDAALLPVVAGGVLTLDAAVRTRVGHGALGSFLVDAVALALIVGSHGIQAPLVALLAYLLVGSALLVPRPGPAWVIAAATAAFLSSTFLSGIDPGQSTMDVDGATAVAIWFQFAILAIATTLLLLEGTDQIRAAGRRHEEALAAEKRASDMKTQFVSMVSHELRTPLTNISGFADTLGEAWRTLSPEEIDEFVSIIQTEAEHLGNLVDDVLAIPRLETGRLLVDITDFALRPLAYRIADLIFPAGGEKQASVQVPGNVVVKADPNRVEQVLRNLLDNARKYGGERVGIETFPRGESQVIVVADNGHGVPEEARERIFEQFEQVSRGDTRTDSGVGLGLTVTRRLVEAMGGEVWYEPGFPVGARFCFSLPVGDPAEAAARAADGAGAIP